MQKNIYIYISWFTCHVTDLAGRTGYTVIAANRPSFLEDLVSSWWTNGTAYRHWNLVRYNQNRHNIHELNINLDLYLNVLYAHYIAPTSVWPLPHETGMLFMTNW